MDHNESTGKMKYQQINLFKLKCIQATQFIDVNVVVVVIVIVDDGRKNTARQTYTEILFVFCLEHLMHLNLKQNNLWWGHLNKKKYILKEKTTLYFMHISNVESKLAQKQANFILKKWEKQQRGEAEEKKKKIII